MDLEVHNLQRAQYFVGLEVQILWQVQYFVDLEVQISWRVQYSVDIEMLRGRQPVEGGSGESGTARQLELAIARSKDATRDS